MAVDVVRVDRHDREPARPRSRARSAASPSADVLHVRAVVADEHHEERPARRRSRRGRQAVLRVRQPEVGRRGSEREHRRRSVGHVALQHDGAGLPGRLLRAQRRARHRADLLQPNGEGAPLRTAAITSRTAPAGPCPDSASWLRPPIRRVSRKLSQWRSAVGGDLEALLREPAPRWRGTGSGGRAVGEAEQRDDRVVGLRVAAERARVDAGRAARRPGTRTDRRSGSASPTIAPAADGGIGDARCRAGVAPAATV